MFPLSKAWPCLALLTIAASPLAASPQYTTINAPGGTQGTAASGINDKGQIVGFDADGATDHGFLLYNRTYVTFNDPKAPQQIDAFGNSGTYILGISNNSVGVGTYYDGSGGAHGFLVNQNGSATLDDPLAAPGYCLGTVASGINVFGQVVGYYYDSTGQAHGFLRRPDGHYAPISGPAGASDIQPAAINDMGQIVGAYTAGSTAEGFLLDQNVWTPITGPAGSVAAAATGINNKGQIVGYYYDGMTYHGFLLNHGAYTTLDAPLAYNTQASGINDSGQIVGFYFDNVGGHGFVLNP